MYYSEIQLELSEIDLNYLKFIWKLLKLTSKVQFEFGLTLNAKEEVSYMVDIPPPETIGMGLTEILSDLKTMVEDRIREYLK